MVDMSDVIVLAVLFNIITVVGEFYYIRILGLDWYSTLLLPDLSRISIDINSKTFLSSRNRIKDEYT